MPSDFLSPLKVPKRAATLAAATLTLLAIAGASTAWTFTKETPNGQSAARDIVCWKSGSGAGVCIDETGGIRGSGSVVANGVTLGAGGGGGGLSVGGGTMTGGLLIQSGTAHAPLPTIDAGLVLEFVGAASGRTLHTMDGLTTSGSLVVENSLTVDGGRVSTGYTLFAVNMTHQKVVASPLGESTFSAVATIPANTLQVGDIIRFTLTLHFPRKS